MGRVKEHLAVKFFVGITFTPSTNLDKIHSQLESLFSTIELRSFIYNFSGFTDYYQAEMGDDLKKQFIVFSRLQRPDILPEIKLETNKIEDEHIPNKNRVVNLDPGYVSEAKVVLATTKNYDHRLYLGRGIFGDLHLRFTDKSFRSQPWTYPDYHQKEIISFFNNVRMRYFEQLGENY